MFDELFGSIYSRKIVEAHDRLWITVHYIGTTAETPPRHIVLASEALSDFPSPCFTILVKDEDYTNALKDQKALMAKIQEQRKQKAESAIESESKC